jgi:hypothetical protein
LNFKSFNLRQRAQILIFYTTTTTSAFRKQQGEPTQGTLPAKTLDLLITTIQPFLIKVRLTFPPAQAAKFQAQYVFAFKAAIFILGGS